MDSIKMNNQKQFRATHTPVIENSPTGDELAGLLLKSTGEGIYGVDLDGNCTFANPACLKLLGFSSEIELLGQNMHKLVHHTRPSGDPYPVEECRIYQAFRQQKGTHVDDELMFCSDGSSFPAEYRSYPVERDGKLVGCVVTFVDISERRRSEQILAEFARFPEMNPGPVLRLSREGIVQMANQAAHSIFGRKLVGCHWKDICPGINDTSWSNILECTGTNALERRIGGREFVFTHRGDFAGEVMFVFGTDISEQKQAERKLRETDELVRLLLNSTGEGIYGVDLNGNCTFANVTCAKLLKFTSERELLGQHMHNLVHHTRPGGDPYPVEECRIYQAFRQQKGTHVDDELMFCSDGSSFPAEYWSYPVERDGKLVGCVVTFVDISERRQIEEELRQAEKMAALGKLSAGLAHELNNPAAAASRASGQLAQALNELQCAASELAGAQIRPDLWDSLINLVRESRKRASNPIDLSPLVANDLEEEMLSWLDNHGVSDGWVMASTLVAVGIESEHLDRYAAVLSANSFGSLVHWLYRTIMIHDLAAAISRSTQSISDLVNVVKSYSYMDQAALQYIDINEGIKETLTIMKHKLGHDIEVVCKYDRNLPPIQVPGGELNQVWTNLIDNAIDALHEQGIITIGTYLEGNHVNIEIADNGPGIPNEIQARIFEPFFTTKDVGQGTGLGLDVVRRIVMTRCGGQIDFRSQPGETVFLIRIPVGGARRMESKE